MAMQEQIYDVIQSQDTRKPGWSNQSVDSKRHAIKTDVSHNSRTMSQMLINSRVQYAAV